MIVVHSKDGKVVGVAHEIRQPKNQLNISQMAMRQYWLHKIKPKQAFRSIRNSFKTLPQNQKKNHLMEFSSD